VTGGVEVDDTEICTTESRRFLNVWW